VARPSDALVASICWAFCFVWGCWVSEITPFFSGFAAIALFLFFWDWGLLVASGAGDCAYISVVVLGFFFTTSVFAIDLLSPF
jgi:hypothetical protein